MRADTTTDATGCGDIRDPMAGQFIQLHSGKAFFLTAPTPEQVYLSDIASALAKLCRYNGHCREFYSVAEHSVRVSQIVPQEDRLWALLHDAAEAYIGDMVRPLKLLMPQFKEFERRVLVAICLRFDLPHEEPKSVRYADNVLLATEKRDLLAESLRPWGPLPPPLEDRIRPWSWQEARDLFLEHVEAASFGRAW